MNKGYIPLDVYRSSTLGDCSNNGISFTNNTIYIKVPHGNLNEDEIDPKLKFWFEDRGQGYWALIPESVLRPLGRVSFGGNLAATSDGRSPARVFHIHDRFEQG